ncbi:S-layer homology domain-containing protein [Planococcus salinus]|uniref:S-layer homology domain-containing protein n=1 Tax=Planococcus salinus TaxID=1848460 RepID=A0A3M8P7E2_9BACL|nr:S-layer homology domain-containing protein [Planococcus salinus]RNF39608.1 S-layer homology domain-containing protein [Planococcus salinus]
MNFCTNQLIKKVFLSSVLLAFLFSSISVTAANTNFTDVSDRYLESVEYLSENGLANGISKTQFGVGKQIKRGDAAIILANALELSEDAPGSGFIDVPDRGVKAINALKHAGVINGKSASNFGFNDNLKRGEIALMLTKASAYNLQGDVKNLTFTDVNNRYQKAVAALVNHKVTSGKTLTRFGTDDLITRGEYAVFIYRAEMIDEGIPFETGVPSALEIFKLIQQAEQNATDSFGDAFVETYEGYAFNKSFQDITEGLDTHYTKDFISNELKGVYDNPILILETLYAFPFTEIPTDKYYIEESNEKIEVYYEGVFYEEPTVYHYTLVLEDNLWKIDLQESFLTPEEAELAVRMVEEIYSESVYVETSLGMEEKFDDYINTILNGNEYSIQVYVLNEYSTGTLGWYTVDPRSSVVSRYEVTTNEYIEIGTPY